MTIYEFEDKIYFDGAISAGIAELEDTSAEEIDNTAENADTGDIDNSENVSIAPDSPSTEGPGDNEETGSDDGSDEVSSDSESNEPALSSLGEGGSTESDDIAALPDSITDTTIADDFLDNQNFLIISSDNENFEGIADSLNDNTTLIVYDSDDSFDSIIKQLKVELGDSKAVNIGILNNERLIENNEECNDFLDYLHNLQYYDSEINILETENDTKSNRLLITKNQLLISDSDFWIAAEDAIILSDYFDSDSSFITTCNE